LPAGIRRLTWASVIEERVTNFETALARSMTQSAAILPAIHEDGAEIRASNAAPNATS
jgi:flagellar biosynthesis regulator FlaF